MKRKNYKVRKLTKALAMMSLVAPFGLHALGVGEIKLNSALNQNLEAEIPLLTSGPESISDLRVNLASPNAYTRAGIDRHFFLNKLRFKPEQKPDGTIVVKVTSREVVREPYLNFLVEVNWPQGRLLREFTVLLDPPVVFNETTDVTPSTPIVSSQNLTNETATKNAVSEAAGENAPNDISSKYAVDQTLGPDTSGLTQRGDTLWSIAKQIKTDETISIEQMMIGLYQANPKAFYKNNVNALMAGHELRVPEQDVILRLSRGEAREEFDRQVAVWEGKLTQKPASESKSQVASADSDSQPEAQLRLMTPKKTGTLENNPSADSIGSVASKVDLAMEMADTVSQENEDLRSRLVQLEQQIEAMKAVLSVKNQQLAEFSTRRQGTDLVKENSPVTEIDLDKDDAKTSELNVERDSDGLGQEQDGLGQEQSAMDQEQNKSGLDQKDLSSTEESVLPVDQNVAKEQATKSSVKPTIQDNDLLSEILDNPYYLAATLSGLLILGLCILKVVRRRNADSFIDTETDSALTFNEESIADELIEAEQEESAKSSAEVEESPSEEMVATAAESSFLSEFTPSDFDAFEMETDEVDPISEADVYLAYGRYQQAENLIRQAISDNPDRIECKLKLLEIHFATENKEAFESYAMELKEDNIDIDSNFWEKVAEMGRELCPNSAFFKEGVELTESLDDMLSEGLELSEPLLLDNQPTDTEVDEPVFEQQEMIDLDAEQKTPLEVDSREDSESVDVELADFSDMNELHFEQDQDAKVVDSEDENSLQFESGELSDSVEESVTSDADEILSPSSQNNDPLEFNLSVNDSVELEANSLDNVSAEPNDQIPPATTTEAAFEVTDESSTSEEPLNMDSDAEEESSDVQLDFDMESTLPDENSIEEIDSDSDKKTESSNLSDINEGLDISDLDLEHVDVDHQDPEDVNIDAVAVGDADSVDNAGSSTILDMDEIEAKLDLAKAYVGMDDQDSASEILMEVLDQGSEEQKIEAQALADTLKKQSSM